MERSVKYQAIPDDVRVQQLTMTDSAQPLLRRIASNPRGSFPLSNRSFLFVFATAAIIFFVFTWTVLPRTRGIAGVDSFHNLGRKARQPMWYRFRLFGSSEKNLHSWSHSYGRGGDMLRGVPQRQAEEFGLAERSHHHPRVGRPSLNQIGRPLIVPMPMSRISVSGGSIFVQTKKCVLQKRCRAVLVLDDSGDELTVEVGFLIRSADDQIRSVDNRTKSNIEGITIEEAKTWSAELLNSVSAELTEAHCEVAIDDVANAILIATKVVETCDTVGAFGCIELLPVKSCLPSGECTESVDTEAEKACEQAVNVPVDQAPKSNSEFLALPCGGLHSFFAFAYVDLPFCTVACTESPCSKRTIFASFVVHKFGFSLETDCIPSVIIPTYHALYADKGLPDCAEMEDSFQGRYNKYILIEREGDLPATVQSYVRSACPSDLTIAIVHFDMPDVWPVSASDVCKQ